MSTTDDLTLITQIRNGSESHFQLLFEKYWIRLYNLANNALDSEDDAKDIVQELFIDIWNRREKLDIENVGGYLFKSVSYGIAKKLQHTINHRTEELFEAIKDEKNLSSEIALRDLIGYVEGKIDQLPNRTGEILKLSKIEQLSNKEIAEKLNLSIRTVENQIYRAIKALKTDERLSDELSIIAIISILFRY